MKKIGKQVLLLPTGEQIKRSGEGAFIRLKDGSIMYAFTEYVGLSNEDHHPASIVAVYSRDEGESWGEKRTLITRRECDKNVMSVSLLRMLNGDLGMIFLRKTGNACVPNIVRSTDEGLTWSEPVICTDNEYYCVLNDGVTRLRNGNILMPANMHASPEAPTSVQFTYCSEDDGRTWKKLGEPVRHPWPHTTTGLQESGFYELPDGRIMGWARTRNLSQFLMFSKDGGVTWSEPMGSELFTGPDAPMRIKDVGPYTLAIYNPMPRYYGRIEHQVNETGKGLWARTPFVCLVSHDRGLTFTEGYMLEDDPAESFCYPAIFEGDDYFLVAYYYSNGSGLCLSSGKILKVRFSELEGGFKTPPKVLLSHTMQLEANA